MKIRSKEPYWLLRNGILNSYSSLRKNISCDVLVVGGGITGALMAYQIAREGFQTVVVDKRDIGTGSSSATTSMIQYEIDEPLYRLMETVGKDAAIDVYREGVKAIHKLGEIVGNINSDCGFSYKQSLHFAETLKHAEHLKQELECRKMAGINARWLTKEDIKAEYSLISAGGILSETAASMDAFRFTHALMQYTIQNFSLQVYDHVEVKSVDYETNKNFVYLDTGAVIECNRIIYATGYETHELLNTSIGKLISTYACISEPFDTLPKALTETLFWNTEDPYFYFRTTHDNRILMGGEDVKFKNPLRRDALIEKKEADLVSKFKTKLEDIDFVADFSWAGTFGATKDSLPYIGPHPDFPNSYFMLGFGGNGITFSIMGMEIISDAIAQRPNKFLEYFKFKR